MLPVAGMLCVVFGASLMPGTITQLATGHYAHVLPYGRARLLASGFCTVALVAAVASATREPLLPPRDVPPMRLVFERAFTLSLLGYTLLYIVLWFMGRSRSIGKLVGLAGVIATLALPLRFFGGAIDVARLALGRLRAALGSARGRVTARSAARARRGAGPSTRSPSGSAATRIAAAGAKSTSCSGPQTRGRSRSARSRRC